MPSLDFKSYIEAVRKGDVKKLVSLVKATRSEKKKPSEDTPAHESKPTSTLSSPRPSARHTENQPVHETHEHHSSARRTPPKIHREPIEFKTKKIGGGITDFHYDPRSKTLRIGDRVYQNVEGITTDKTGALVNITVRHNGALITFDPQTGRVAYAEKGQTFLDFENQRAVVSGKQKKITDKTATAKAKEMGINIHAPKPYHEKLEEQHKFYGAKAMALTLEQQINAEMGGGQYVVAKRNPDGSWRLEINEEIAKRDPRIAQRLNELLSKAVQSSKHVFTAAEVKQSQGGFILKDKPYDEKYYQSKYFSSNPPTQLEIRGEDIVVRYANGEQKTLAEMNPEERERFMKAYKKQLDQLVAQAQSQITNESSITSPTLKLTKEGKVILANPSIGEMAGRVKDKALAWAGEQVETAKAHVKAKTQEAKEKASALLKQKAQEIKTKAIAALAQAGEEISSGFGVSWEKMAGITDIQEQADEYKRRAEALKPWTVAPAEGLLSWGYSDLGTAAGLAETKLAEAAVGVKAFAEGLLGGPSIQTLTEEEKLKALDQYYQNKALYEARKKWAHPSPKALVSQLTSAGFALPALFIAGGEAVARAPAEVGEALKDFAAGGTVATAVEEGGKTIAQPRYKPFSNPRATAAEFTAGGLSAWTFGQTLPVAKDVFSGSNAVVDNLLASTSAGTAAGITYSTTKQAVEKGGLSKTNFGEVMGTARNFALFSGAVELGSMAVGKALASFSEGVKAGSLPTIGRTKVKIMRAESPTDLEKVYEGEQWYIRKGSKRLPLLTRDIYGTTLGKAEMKQETAAYFPTEKGIAKTTVRTSFERGTPYFSQSISTTHISSEGVEQGLREISWQPSMGVEFKQEVSRASPSGRLEKATLRAKPNPSENSMGLMLERFSLDNGQADYVRKAWAEPTEGGIELPKTYMQAEQWELGIGRRTSMFGLEGFAEPEESVGGELVKYIPKKEQSPIEKLRTEFSRKLSETKAQAESYIQGKIDEALSTFEPEEPRLSFETEEGEPEVSRGLKQMQKQKSEEITFEQPQISLEEFEPEEPSLNFEQPKVMPLAGVGLKQKMKVKQRAKVKTKQTTSPVLQDMMPQLTFFTTKPKVKVEQKRRIPSAVVNLVSLFSPKPIFASTPKVSARTKTATTPVSPSITVPFQPQLTIPTTPVDLTPFEPTPPSAPAPIPAPPIKPPARPPVALASFIPEPPAFPSGSGKVRNRPKKLGLLADLLSVEISEQVFGRATSPNLNNKKVWRIAQRTGFEFVPTAEMLQTGMLEFGLAPKGKFKKKKKRKKGL